MIDPQPVKGTRDFFPEDMRLRNWLFDLWRETARQYAFEEYDACVLEHMDLYARKAGDEIAEQLYCFEDKGGRMLSLRPEMTPSLARMVLQRQRGLALPIKWFAVAQCFRYERMTRGRKREHFQWNADIVGQPSEVAEAEAVAMLLSACRKMGLGPEDLRVFLNDRRILNAALERLGVDEGRRLEALIVMDKRDKITPEAFAELLAQKGLAPDQVSGLRAFLELDSLDAVDRELGGAAAAPLRRAMDLLDGMGWGAWLRFDASIVRGLSYYTGTVFEVNHPEKKYRAVAGGGRYDSLLSTFGGAEVPAVGFGFGDVVILELLADLGRLPAPKQGLDWVVAPFEEGQHALAMRLADALRAGGARVECSFRKFKKTLQFADERGAAKAMLLFPEELASGKVVVKDLQSKTQESLPLAGFLGE